MLVAASQYVIAVGTAAVDLLNRGKKAVYSKLGDKIKVKLPPRFFPVLKKDLNMLLNIEYNTKAIRCLPVAYGFITSGLKHLGISKVWDIWPINANQSTKELSDLRAYGNGYTTGNLFVTEPSTSTIDARFNIETSPITF
jgi:hypothetical protein